MGLVNAACINFRPRPEPLPDELSGDRPAEVWSKQAGRGFTAPLAPADSVVYGGGYGREVFAVSLADGEVLWKSRLGGPMIGGVVVHDSMVYTATARPDGKVYGIRRADGRVLWRTRTGNTIVPVAVVGGHVVTHAIREGVAAVDAATGRLAWRARARPGRAAPLEAGGAIIATGIDTIYRIDPDDGTILHRRPLPGAVLGGWERAGRLLVAGTADSLVIAVDPETLEAVWTREVDAPVLHAPVARGDTLVAVSRRGTVYRLVGVEAPRLERVTELRWPVTAAPVLFDDLLILGGADGTLRAITPNGGERWRMVIWKPVEVPPVAADGALIATGGNGDLYRLEP